MGYMDAIMEVMVYGTGLVVIGMVALICFVALISWVARVVVRCCRLMVGRR